MIRKMMQYYVGEKNHTEHLLTYLMMVIFNFSTSQFSPFQISPLWDW